MFFDGPVEVADQPFIDPPLNGIRIPYQKDQIEVNAGKVINYNSTDWIFFLYLSNYKILS